MRRFSAPATVYAAAPKKQSVTSTVWPAAPVVATSCRANTLLKTFLRAKPEAKPESVTAAPAQSVTRLWATTLRVNWVTGL